MDKPSALRKLTVLWGKTFRVFFIISVGVGAYLWFEPKSLMDVPFSNLTFRMLTNNALGVLTPLGCIYWLFNAPQNSEDESAENDPYIIWANFSFLVAVGIAIAFLYLKKQA